MKIFRVAEEKVAPSWAFGNKSLDDYQEKEMVDLERLNVTPSQNVTEETLLAECKHIELCASSGKTYHYNSTWSDSHISHLKEYASVCGLTSVKGIDPKVVIEDRTQITQEAQNSRNIKVASVALPDQKKIDLGDPFHLEERSDISHMEKTKWQEVKKQANMKEVPVMLNGNIIPIRGGEDYFKNSDIKANAKNQNSIADPDTIKNLAEGTKEDNGMMLKRLQKEKEEMKKQTHASWQKDIVDSMEYKEIVPRGKVFPTESMNAQSGLNSPSSKMGVYAKFDPENIPSKTQGELIKEQNEAEHKRINPRAEKAKYEFEMSHQANRKISDVFSEQLKKYVK